MTGRGIFISQHSFGLHFAIYLVYYIAKCDKFDKADTRYEYFSFFFTDFNKSTITLAENMNHMLHYNGK